MGGVSIAMSHPKAVNFSNPAAFAATDSLSFLMDVATSANFNYYRDQATGKPSLQGGLDYIAVQLPLLGDRLGLSMGLIPLFYTGYGMQTEQPVEGDTEGITYLQNFTGRGSFQTAYLGLGAKVTRNLYLGASAKYLFGSETHTWRMVPNYSQLTQSLESYQLRMSELQVEAGLQYRLTLPGKKGTDKGKWDHLTIGATYSPRLPVKPEATILVNRNVNSQTRPDIENKQLTLDTAMPHEIGVGLSWDRPEKIALSADFRTALWSDVPNIFVKDGVQLVNSYYVAAGFQMLPNPYSGRYGRQMTFSGGVNYSSSYLDVAPVGTMKYVGASVGFGFPIFLYGLERNSMLNLSLEYKHGIAAEESGFSNDMVRLTLGFTFNETWFQKLRIR